MSRTIREASAVADVTIVVFHSHEREGMLDEVPDPAVLDVYRQAIESGANAVVAHGAHVCRPIEEHKGAPIFSGVGHFIFQPTSSVAYPSELRSRLGATLNAPNYAIASKLWNFRDPKYWIGGVAQLKIRSGSIDGFELIRFRLDRNINGASYGYPIAGE